MSHCFTAATQPQHLNVGPFTQTTTMPDTSHTKIIHGFYRYTDIWFEWYGVVFLGVHVHDRDVHFPEITGIRFCRTGRMVTPSKLS